MRSIVLALTARERKLTSQRSTPATPIKSLGQAVAHFRVLLRRALEARGTVKLSTSLRLCDGHRGVPHGKIEGRHKDGTRRIEQAKILTTEFATALSDDLWTHLQIQETRSGGPDGRKQKLQPTDYSNRAAGKSQLCGHFLLHRQRSPCDPATTLQTMQGQG